MDFVKVTVNIGYRNDDALELFQDWATEYPCRFCMQLLEQEISQVEVHQRIVHVVAEIRAAMVINRYIRVLSE
ncbi:hypothetical protein BGZ59_011152 [Podila verticillata]|nr:hypothetical protein BGZ59_011152 [Podila verticillata]